MEDYVEQIKLPCYASITNRAVFWSKRFPHQACGAKIFWF